MKKKNALKNETIKMQYRSASVVSAWMVEFRWEIAKQNETAAASAAAAATNRLDSSQKNWKRRKKDKKTKRKKKTISKAR